MSTLAVRCSTKIFGSKFAGPCRTLGVTFFQSAGITSPGGQTWKRENKPFNYRSKKLSMFQQIFDRTLTRMDENSKVIIVDGPIASGKTEFAKKLAKELDFKFVGQSNPQNVSAFGKRHFTSDDSNQFFLGPVVKNYDLETLLKDSVKPDRTRACSRAAGLQQHFFTARLCTYNDALLHLLSTGQGIVCVRSPWSDRVFANALADTGYISRACFNYFEDELYPNHTIEYPRPHIAIYLDANVEDTKENIKRRNDEWENNSLIFSDTFLTSIEESYKSVVLPIYEHHNELLIYPSIQDITDHEISLVVDDIEALGPLEHSGISDDHFLEDWKYLRDEELAHKRRLYEDLQIPEYVEAHCLVSGLPELLIEEDWQCEDYLDIANTLDSDGFRWPEDRYDPTLPWWKVVVRKQPTERRRFWVSA